MSAAAAAAAAAASVDLKEHHPLRTWLLSGRGAQTRQPSATIANALLDAAAEVGVEIVCKAKVVDVAVVVVLLVVMLCSPIVLDSSKRRRTLCFLEIATSRFSVGHHWNRKVSNGHYQ